MVSRRYILELPEVVRDERGVMVDWLLVGDDGFICEGMRGLLRHGSSGRESHSRFSVSDILLRLRLLELAPLLPM
jgi:hypothetical protein